MFFRCVLFSCMLILMQLFSTNANAQKVIFNTKYLNNNYLPTTEDSATVKEIYYRIDKNWQIDRYNKDSLNQPFYLTQESLLPDTSQKPFWKKLTYFYEDGKKKEYRHSEDTITTYAEHYNKKGKKDGQAVWKNDSLILSKGWDAKGKLIPHFIYEREATYRDDLRAWKQFLEMTIRPDVPQENGAPAGKNYTVVVSFIVDKDGSVTKVKAENDPGYGSAQEAERVIKTSLNWHPAIYMNKPVVYRQRQQITFQVLEETDTIQVGYLDKNLQPTISSSTATFKVHRSNVNDSTFYEKIYLINSLVLINDATYTMTANGSQKIHAKTYNQFGVLVGESDMINSKMVKLIKFHSNGIKSEEIVYGDETGLPIKSTRWDENGQLIP